MVPRVVDGEPGVRVVEIALAEPVEDAPEAEDGTYERDDDECQGPSGAAPARQGGEQGADDPTAA
jgi:hypothetical protein